MKKKVKKIKLNKDMRDKLINFAVETLSKPSKKEHKTIMEFVKKYNASMDTQIAKYFPEKDMKVLAKYGTSVKAKSKSIYLSNGKDKDKDKWVKVMADDPNISHITFTPIIRKLLGEIKVKEAEYFEHISEVKSEVLVPYYGASPTITSTSLYNLMQKYMSYLEELGKQREEALIHYRTVIKQCKNLHEVFDVWSEAKEIEQALLSCAPVGQVSLALISKDAIDFIKKDQAKRRAK